MICRIVYQTSDQDNVSTQIFRCSRCITLHRVTSLQSLSSRHCAQATQLLSKKCWSGGKPLATLCPI